MSQPLRRLSEQDLAQLYLHTEAPLRLDDLLQGQAMGDAAQVAVHDSISGQTPDLALISLSLCGLIIARDYPAALKDGEMGPVLREMAVAAENNLVSVGRLWLDSACYGIAPDPAADLETIESIPDRLRILTSIFQELGDALDGQGALMPAALKTLYYQAESHADLAEKFVNSLARSVRRPRKPASSPKAAPPARRVPDQIPLPFELTRPQAGAEVVAFSLFRQKDRA